MVVLVQYEWVWRAHFSSSLPEFLILMCKAIHGSLHAKHCFLSLFLFEILIFLFPKNLLFSPWLNGFFSFVNHSIDKFYIILNNVFPLLEKLLRLLRLLLSLFFVYIIQYIYLLRIHPLVLDVCLLCYRRFSLHF